MSNARQAAAMVVHAVAENGESLDAALAHHSISLQANEAALCQEIAYGGVRWYLAYSAYLDKQLKKPFKAKDSIISAILVTALYQLDFTRQAPHAVVHEAVDLTGKLNREWAAGVVNAILRKYMREQATRPQTKQSKWYQQSFPDWLYNEILKDWPEYIERIISAAQTKPPMTLRVNTKCQSRKDYLEILANTGIEAAPCVDSPVGIELNTPTTVSNLPGFDVGWVSIQDESAQLAVTMLDLAPGQNVLDACAAPGGKSMHILEHVTKLKQLTVLDFPKRMQPLRQNFSRAGLIANIVEGDLREPDKWWDGELYDRILLDAPCTGAGVIRRHPDIKLRRQAENVLQFAVNQQHFLANALDMLKPGGKLLYTTCSILKAENEHCVAQFVAKAAGVYALLLPENLGIRTPHGSQRLPGVHSGDGFYYALLQKTN